MLNRKALEELSKDSIPVEYLKREHFKSICKSTDLHAYGYAITVWWHVKRNQIVYEYRPRLSDLPRLTAGNYAEQCRVHHALGINIVPPGKDWVDLKPLWDKANTRRHGRQAHPPRSPRG